MKKALSCVLTAAGCILAALGIIASVHKNETVATSIAVIGGADGPTSVFLAGKLGNGAVLAPVIVGIVLVAAGVSLFVRVKKR